MKNSTRNVSAITMENTGDKHNSYHRKAISCYHKLIPCVVSEKNWDRKDKGISLMHVLDILQLAKRHSLE